MVLSSPIKIFDPIRNLFVIETPEEKVRQEFVQKLLNAGYPRELIQVEVDIKSASLEKNTPQRRADIICYAKKESGLFPLLLVECKAVAITKKTKAQVLGYNYYIGAENLCLVNQEQVYFARLSHSIKFEQRFYSYADLIHQNP